MEKHVSGRESNPRVTATSLNDDVAPMLHNTRLDGDQTVKLLSRLNFDQRNVETSNLISDLLLALNCVKRSQSLI